MNTPAPLPPDQLDELLSADLDDAFAAAASELGMTAPEARARLDATPGAGDRRSALTAARDALAESPELAEVQVRALVDRALDRAAPDEVAARRATRDARRRALTWATTAAAALLVVVGLGYAISNGLGESQGTDVSTAAADSDATSESARTTLAVPLTADLGAIANPDELRARLTARLTAAGTSDDPDQKETARSSTLDLTAGTAFDADCVEQLRSELDAAGALELVARARYDGVPATVYVFGTPDGALVAVVDTACSVLTTLPLP